VFQRQFEAADDHKWTSCEKAAHLLAVLLGQVADVLHSLPPGATYEDIVGALKGRYGNHRLAATYRTQLNARTQLIGESRQEFGAAVEQLAHRVIVELPVDFIKKEAAHTFFEEMRDREVKLHRLMVATGRSTRL
jgi:hypothetical protein